MFRNTMTTDFSKTLYIMPGLKVKHIREANECIEAYLCSGASIDQVLAIPPNISRIHVDPEISDTLIDMLPDSVDTLSLLDNNQHSSQVTSLKARIKTVIINSDITEHDIKSILNQKKILGISSDLTGFGTNDEGESASLLSIISQHKFFNEYKLFGNVSAYTTSRLKCKAAHIMHGADPAAIMHIHPSVRIAQIYPDTSIKAIESLPATMTTAVFHPGTNAQQARSFGRNFKNAILLAGVDAETARSLSRHFTFIRTSKNISLEVKKTLVQMVEESQSPQNKNDTSISSTNHLSTAMLLNQLPKVVNTLKRPRDESPSGSEAQLSKKLKLDSRLKLNVFHLKATRKKPDEKERMHVRYFR